jgi:hypothetical protein
MYHGDSLYPISAVTEQVLADFLTTVNVDTSLQEKLKAALPCSPLREAVVAIAHEAGFMLSRAQAEMVAMQIRCGDVLL